MLAAPATKVKTLRSHLIQLVLVAVLPLLFFSSGLIIYLTHQQNSELEKELDHRVTAVSSIIDDSLNSIISSLQILTITEDFDPRRFRDLHSKLRHTVKELKGWSSMSVVDLKGNQLLHTAFDYGDKTFSLKELPHFQEVLKTKRPVFSNLRIGRKSGSKLFSVAMPVIREKQMTLILIVNVSLDLLADTMKKLTLDPEWYATLIDRNLTIMARTKAADQFVGTKVSDSVVNNLLDSEKGILRSINKEGIDSYSVYTRSQLTGWRIVLGFPSKKLSTFPGLLRLILLSALAVILLGIFLAIRSGCKISEPIVALSHSAEALGKGYSPMAIETSVEEIKILAKNLELASLQRIRSENTIRTIHEISSSLAAELDIKRLLQSFTDQSVALVRAEFGAYFNVNAENKDFYNMVTLSGAPKEKFSQFPLPRNTEVFGPTFRGEGIVRSDDITKDPRYGKNPPYYGTPPGHLPVKSYLAVPVISRSGEVLGGLFFGHSRAGVFTEQDEKIMGALAAQAATAIDNATLYAKATQAIELRDTFLSVASHELKTPLTSIYLQFEILKRSTLTGTDEDKKILNLFERFQSQLERLTRLINELLDVTRIASGKMKLNPEKIELSSLIRDICANFESEAIQKGCPISLHIPEPIEGTWDSNRIEQVIMNLVSNAIKYGNKKPIEVSATKDGHWAMIRIKDEGMGIAPEDQGRIFQRFERAIDSSNISGLGLGLFICKEIIIRHGGIISVESKLGEGSTFTIRLPLS